MLPKSGLGCENTKGHFNLVKVYSIINNFLVDIVRHFGNLNSENTLFMQYSKKPVEYHAIF